MWLWRNRKFTARKDRKTFSSKSCNIQGLCLLSFGHLFSMALSLWITIISICCMYSEVTSTVVGDTSVSADTVNGTTEPTNTGLTSTQITYISICIPLAVVLLAAIITIVLVFIYRRKRGRGCLHQESIFYGNAGNVSMEVDHNVYKPKEKEKDDYGSKPPLTTKEEPIYINVQGKCSVEPNVAGDRTENIYCNVGYDTQQ
ncbi:uncharacterized protein LOC132858145 [Tachysurus vachellii]|uniref:uncharacterized protein LOC132858145 n=1 Tax=Tachysurus vachellii TaxID=175792 RepID=UPI00296AFB1A|nr:uncharacterized protein LOC132858145 [Tachysurus vachellii]